MSIYLICIYILAIALIMVCVFFVGISVNNKLKNKKVKADNFKQKKSALYIKYNIKTKEMVINNYT